ncbi:MAG: hypothetical protein JWR63_3247, partial [Conexibacter sp.]|nr:hypothetical protein [Conexibacter sp.]
PHAGDPDVEPPVTPDTTAEPEAQVEPEAPATGDDDAAA